MQRGFAAKELEWAREEDVPGRRHVQGVPCLYAAAVSAADGMSEEALTQWMDFVLAGVPSEPPAAGSRPPDKTLVSSACLRLPIHIQKFY